MFTLEREPARRFSRASDRIASDKVTRDPSSRPGAGRGIRYASGNARGKKTSPARREIINVNKNEEERERRRQDPCRAACSTRRDARSNERYRYQTSVRYIARR